MHVGFVELGQELSGCCLQQTALAWNCHGLVELDGHVAKNADGRDFALHWRLAFGVQRKLFDLPFVVIDDLNLTNVTCQTHIL